MSSLRQFFTGGIILNIVYPICCGVDVHKRFFVATIITSEGIEAKYKKQRFSTFNNEILKFKAWLLENNCRDICMESTGKYWIPVSNLLEDSINVTIKTKGEINMATNRSYISEFRINAVELAIMTVSDF